MKISKIFSTAMIFTFGIGKIALAGGVHIGGGNTSERIPDTQTEIQNLLEHFHQSRSEFVTSLQVAGLTSKRLLNTESKLSKPLDPIEKNKLLSQTQLYEVLFQKPIDPQQIKNIKLHFSNNDCLDNLGNANDASVVDSDISTICFSLPRLESKLGKDNFEIELLALYVHELTHCFGSDEPEAEAIQNDLRDLGAKAKDYLSFLNLQTPSLKAQIEGFLKQINQIELQVKNKDLLCSSLNKISEEMLNLTVEQSGKTAGQAVLGYHGIIAFHGAYVVSAYLNDYCDSVSEFRKQIKFKDHQQLYARDLYPDPTLLFAPLGKDSALKLSAYLLADLSDAVVTATTVGDLKGLNSNLQELKRLLELSLSEKSSR